MNLADIPAWFAKRFGADATGSYIRTVPATTVDPNAASMALGFPPNTFVDEGAGGSPPDGRDVNGILNFLSAWAQWQGAGGPIPWNASVAAIGYPLGAVVMSNTAPGLPWRSTVDGNTTNPDAAGAGWVPVVNRRASASDLIAGTDDILAATSKALADAGFRRVASSAPTSNGYRLFGDGFKMCWGREIVSANSTLLVTVPILHSSFIIPTLGAEMVNTAGEANRVGVLPPTSNAFTLVNRNAASVAVNWQTVGF